MPEAKQFSTTIGGRTVTLETGKLAQLAGGSVAIRVGETMLLAAATMSRDPRMGIDFFPLSVDYEERLYAIGKIPGSFFRREGRPSEQAILTSRLIDRPMRPLFPSDLHNDVQIIVTALSVDQIEQPDVLAITAASAALTISDIPFGKPGFDGPVGAVRVGLIDGEFVANPTYPQMEHSTLDLRIAGTREAIVMVECGADEIPEDVMARALVFGHQSLQPLIDLQEQMAREVGKPVRDYQKFVVDPALVKEIGAKAHDRMAAAVANANKAERNTAMDALNKEILAGYEGSTTATPADIKSILHDIEKDVVRSRILKDGVRPDGRGLKEIRPLSAEVGVAPRAHGSGLFTRGETQILSLVTLGTPRDAQELDTLSPEDKKRYMHHYNFPPFSTGETRPMRGSSRREIGHGALAERALVPVLPSKDDFAYTLRVVSEALSSNGSTSMGSVCGSTLALMDAGVPIKAPVGGISIGLIQDGDKYALLTDIQGLEDHQGDMDFKVAGTAVGITALQLDIKTKGLTAEILSKAMDQAREARGQILDLIASVLPAPRADLSAYAPRLTVIKIDPGKIGAIIGPGGKTIRKIQEDTGVRIDIEDDGTVMIAATEGPAAQRAREMIEGLTETARVGQIYTGKVVRVADFGAFVEILPGTDGMVHISQLASERVEKVEDVARLGDELTVMVTAIDDSGKIRLSRQAVLEGWTPEEALDHDRKPSGGGGRPSGGGDRGRGGDRGGRGGGDRGGRR